MTKESDIVYDNGKFWIEELENCYKLWQQGVTHSTLKGTYGKGDEFFKAAVGRADSLKEQFYQLRKDSK